MARKRFKFQFSLRALFVITFIFGPLLGTYVYRVRQRPVDARQAIAKLEAKECSVLFKLQNPAEADFMSKWLGAEPFPVHCDVQASYRKLHDEDMALLGALTDYDALHLNGNKVGDSGFFHLRRVKRIHKLILDETDITDDGVNYLSAVHGIDYLTLSKTAVTDRGAAMLAQRTDVTILRLDKTKITDEGLKEIGKMKQLVDLDLSDCSITDDGIGHLTPLANLIHLDLSGTGLTDEGLAHFYPMKKLDSVEVYRCAVSVEAIRRLCFSREDNHIGFTGDQQ